MILLSLKTASTIPLDLAGILPSTLAKLGEASIARLPVLHGNRVVELGEFFDVSRELEDVTDESMLRFAGGCSLASNLGAGMDGGHVIVDGHAGTGAFARMSGGWVSIEGDAGDELAANMSGGSLWVGGNCGHRPGAASPGRRKGMTGGRIVIEGNAGDDVGAKMRRGVIRIHGNCGVFAGRGMIAGTLFVKGHFGDNPGAGMKRGTLITMSDLPKLSPGFRYSCDYEPAWLRLFDSELGGRVRCYRGDALAGGRGEMWQIIG